MQPRVPAEFAKPRHRAPDLGLALIEGKKADEIESSTAHTSRVHALKLLVRNPVIDNADAAVAVAIPQAFESVQQQAVVAAVDRAMDDDATIEADRLVHLLRFGERCAFNRRVRRIGSRRKLRRVLVYVKLAIAASPWRRRNRHPRVSVPFVDFFSGCRHCHSPLRRSARR